MRGALAAVAMAAVLAACGAHSNPRRVAVAHYIGQVGQVERALTRPVQEVSRVSAAAASAGRRSRHGRKGAAAGRGTTPAQLAAQSSSLAAALAQIQAQERRLRSLAAPAPAARLRSLLLKLTSDEAALTRQLGLLLNFLPRFSAVMAPVGPELKRLERSLAQNQAQGAAAVAASYRAKAAALRSFQAEAGQLVFGLRGLTPPAASRPQYAAQIASLRRMGRIAGRLAAALERSNPGDLRPLLVDFDRAALATRSLHVQRAERAAVRSYDAAVQRLSVLREQVAQERAKLGRQLS
ncbi:MAG: hypothetical protein ACRDNJ_04575 [Solirubrobacteraceae bacterium]